MRINSWSQRIASSFALLGVTGAVFGACCKYKIDWSSEEGEPCSGNETSFCESASQSAASTDLGARNDSGFRKAKCYHVKLHSAGSFFRIGCDQTPPYGAVFVGTLSDGTCCWATNVQLFDPTTSQEFFVSNCEYICSGGGGGA